LVAIRNGHPRIDLVLLDIALPGVSSREVFEEARRLLPASRVIATSAYSEEAAAAALDAQPDGFIREPLPGRELAELLLRARRSSDNCPDSRFCARLFSGA
jgi:CheY-like chemotaxis protein